MDEWPELEALPAAIDRYDEWPEMALTDGSLANVIDAARDVVRNYRETKAMVATYKAMPVDADQVRRAMGLPPLGESEPTKACIEVPMPEDQGSCACGDPTGRAGITRVSPAGATPPDWSQRVIDTVTIEEHKGTKPVIRARVDRATACYYPDSQRVVLVADKADFPAALDALTELTLEVLAPKEPTP